MKTIRKFSDGFCNFMKISVYEKRNIRKTYIMNQKLIIVKK